MGDYHRYQSRAAEHEPQSTQAQAPIPVPGKRTLTELISVVSVGPEPRAILAVAARAGEHLKDDGGFGYLVRPDGCFEVTSGPAAIGRVIVPMGPYAAVWAKLAARLHETHAASPRPAPPPQPAHASGNRTLDLALAKSDGDKATRYERPTDAAADATAEVKEASKKHSREFAARLAGGSADVDTFYCSGFSIWTLAAAGYKLLEPLVGTDAVPFTYSVPCLKNGRPEVKDGRPVTREVQVSLRDLLDGHADAVEVATIGATWGGKGGSIGMLSGTGHAAGHKRTGDAMDDDLGIKGAAAAFVLARIGTEVSELAQKPGDFAQARWMTNTAGKSVSAEKGGIHRGAGHAWQVASVTVLGSAVFGERGSPHAAATGLTGWNTTTFTIDRDTDPRLVGEHQVIGAKRVEANTKGSLGGEGRDAADTDGGVHLTRDLQVPDKGTALGYVDYSVYYGRLGASPWANWRPAQPPAP